MTRKCLVCRRTALVVVGAVVCCAVFYRANLWAQQPPNSYAPVVMQESFDKTVARMSARSPKSWPGR